MLLPRLVACDVCRVGSRVVAIASLAILACNFVGSPVDPEGESDSGPDAALDATVDGPPAVCGGPTNSAAIGAWRLESLPSPNEVGSGAFALIGTNPQLVASRSPECGNALRLPANNDPTALPTFGQVADDPDWDSFRGFDMFVRTSIVSPRRVALLSRDRPGLAEGGLLVLLVEDNATSAPLVAVRIQSSDARETYRCAPRPIGDEWFHLGVNITDTSIELWINGEVASAPNATFRPFSQIISCSTGEPFALGVSDLPFQVGITGATNPPSLPFRGGTVDNLRFYSAPIDFAAAGAP